MNIKVFLLFAKALCALCVFRLMFRVLLTTAVCVYNIFLCVDVFLCVDFFLCFALIYFLCFDFLFF